MVDEHDDDKPSNFLSQAKKAAQSVKKKGVQWRDQVKYNRVYKEASGNYLNKAVATLQAYVNSGGNKAKREAIQAVLEKYRDAMSQLGDKPIATEKKAEILGYLLDVTRCDPKIGLGKTTQQIYNVLQEKNVIPLQPNVNDLSKLKIPKDLPIDMQAPMLKEKHSRVLKRSTNTEVNTTRGTRRPGWSRPQEQFAKVTMSQLALSQEYGTELSEMSICGDSNRGPMYLSVRNDVGKGTFDLQDPDAVTLLHQSLDKDKSIDLLVLNAVKRYSNEHDLDMTFNQMADHAQAIQKDNRQMLYTADGRAEIITESTKKLDSAVSEYMKGVSAKIRPEST